MAKENVELERLIAEARDFCRHPNVHFHYSDGPRVMSGLADALEQQLAALRPAEDAQAVAWLSCPTCDGTGEHGGNPPYGICGDCGGSGKIGSVDLSPASPQPVPSAVTEEMVRQLAYRFQSIMSETLSVDGEDGEIMGTGTASFQMARAALGGNND